MQRILLAGCAGLLLVAGGILASTDVIAQGSREFVSGTLLKVGFVLGLVWLAAPQLEKLGWQRLRGTMLAIVVAVLILWSIRPRLGAIAGAILIGGSAAFALLGWIRSLGKPPGRR